MKKLTKPVRKIPTHRDGLGFDTLPNMIADRAELYANNTAYINQINGKLHKLTYGQVLEKVTKLARHLQELGYVKGDHIAVLGENRPEWGISFFAVTWIGAVAIPLDARASVNDHEFILRFSSAKAIILTSSYYESIQSLSPSLGDLRDIIVMESINQICEKYSSGAEKGNISKDDLLEILFTSGTTGDPKGVMLTHGNIMSNVDDIYRIIQYTPKDRAFSILPIHHSYECTGGLIAPLASGMSVYYARSLKPRELLQDLKTALPTIWLNTPLLLEKLLVRINKQISSQTGIKGLVSRAIPKKLIGRKVRENLGLNHIRLVASGGAALPGWVSEGFHQYGIDVIQAYGLSEASPLITVNPPSHPKHDSIGMVIPSDEVEIRDIDGEGNGEIVARGPNIMKGYYNNKSATDETLTDDGWLLTGDIGYFDEDGYLYITGRKKFVIVTKGGKNVFPEEIEEKLTKSPFIEEALVFSPDDVDIQALIYPNSEEISSKLGSNTPREEIWEFMKHEIRVINRSLESYKKVRHFAIRTDEFPKTTTRKIKRFLFKDLILTPETKFI